MQCLLQPGRIYSVVFQVAQALGEVGVCRSRDETEQGGLTSTGDLGRQLPLRQHSVLEEGQTRFMTERYRCAPSPCYGRKGFQPLQTSLTALNCLSSCICKGTVTPCRSPSPSQVSPWYFGELFAPSRKAEVLPVPSLVPGAPKLFPSPLRFERLRMRETRGWYQTSGSHSSVYRRLI